MGALRPWHIAILVVVVVLLFGAKRLPTAARSLGQSMRILKAETQGLRDDDAAAKTHAPDSQATPTPSAPPIGRQPAPSDSPAARSTFTHTRDELS